MNEQEKSQYEKFRQDLSSENLTNEEIVSMWKSPIIKKIHDGQHNVQLEQFLTSKGVSKDYLYTAIKNLKEEAAEELAKTKNKDALGGLLTSIMESITSKFKFRK